MSPTCVSLGFVEGRFPAGVHVCQVFLSDAERDQTLREYTAAGLRAGERCACFSDHTGEAGLAKELLISGMLDRDASPAELLVAGTAAAYFAEGRFEPEKMLSQIDAFHEGARAAGYPGARIIGEMTAEIENVPGGSRLLEYEARVSILLRDRPVTTMCQYDARTFEGASIMDILRVHPFVVVRGAVVENPFFAEPEQFLEQHKPRTQ